MSPPNPVEAARPPNADYAAVTAILAITIAAIVLVTHGPNVAAPDPGALLAPVFAMVLLTGSVFVLMGVVRNVSVFLGKASVRYYEAFASEAPPDWIERPARTLNNLMQLPTLFYVVCTLMLVMREVDAAQVALAWLFVATRVVHALVYIVLNRVSFRFAAYLSGGVTLGVLWVRFALATL